MLGIKAVVEQVAKMALSRSAAPSQEGRSASSEDGFECAKCRDYGVVAVIPETGEEVPIGDMRLFDIQNSCLREHTTRQCECMFRKHIERLFRSSHVTDHYRTIGFKGFTIDGRPECVRVARDTALDYYRRFKDLSGQRVGNSLVIVGPPGSGKTHLLMAVTNGLMRNGVAVQYFPWVEGFNDLKDKLSQLEAQTRAMKEVTVLYIDDLYKGRTRPTDFMLEQLFGVINFRYLNGRPILVSSERSFDELFAVDEGIARRIWEMSSGHRVEMALTDREQELGMDLNYSIAGDM